LIFVQNTKSAFTTQKAELNSETKKKELILMSYLHFLV
jgi:hypothetical protein